MNKQIEPNEMIGKTIKSVSFGEKYREHAAMKIVFDDETEILFCTFSAYEATDLFINEQIYNPEDIVWYR